MVSIMEIMQLCRLCLVKEQVNVPIFDEQGDIRQICMKISACLPVKVSKEDKLPKKICDGCLYKLELLYQFYNTTANAEKQLLSWIEQAKMDSKNAAGELTTQPQATVKQEKLEPVESTNETPELSSEAQSYILQQQQLQYQSDFPFKESQGSNADGSASNTSANSDEPIAKRPRRRRQATKPIPPEAIESSDDNDAGDSLMEMTVTKTEEESESDGDDNADDPEPDKYVAVGDDTDQPGPSGLGKGNTDTPVLYQDNVYSNFNYQQEDIVPQVDDSIQSKYYLMMKNAPDLPDNNLLENAVAQLNDSDADLLNLLAAEEDILRDITENEQFEQLINNTVIGNGAEYNMEGANLTENIGELIKIKENDLSQLCDEVKNLDTIEQVDNSLKIENFDEFKCTYCEKVCPTKKLLKNHLMIHTGLRPFSCDICKKTFRHNYEVKVHKKSHNQPSFQCDICSKMFIHKSHLTAHRRKHLGDFAVICDLCDKGFLTQSSYNQHIKVKHDKIMHVCEICGAKLSTLSALNEHKLTHQPHYHEKRSHVCEFCGKSYLSVRYLRSHLKFHTECNDYSCNVCGKTFTTKSNLRKHITNHNASKGFQCGYCGKEFNSKENLTVHKRIHSGDKPFSCNVCGKAFSQKISLTVHTRYHTGDRPYKCGCGQAFFTKSHLVTHSRTHKLNNIDIQFVS